MLQSAPAETGPWTTQHTISTITLPDTAQVEIGAGGWGGTPTGLTNAVFDNFTYDDGTTPTGGGGGGGGDTYTYAYDPAGRRTTVTNSDGTTAFVYDPAGRLISIDDATTTQTRTYDPNGTLIALTATDGVSTQNHALFWDPTGAISELVGIQHRTTGATTLLHTTTTGVAALQRGASIDPAGVDWHNSLLDTPPAAGLAAADTYDPYGNPQPQPALGAVTVGFRGELTTGTLIHLRNRDYDPTTGTFTTTDPLDAVTGTTTIANPYHYANNDPIGLHDPLGLRPSDADFRPAAVCGVGLTLALTDGPLPIGDIIGIGACGAVIAWTLWNAFDQARDLDRPRMTVLRKPKVGNQAQSPDANRSRRVRPGIDPPPLPPLTPNEPDQCDSGPRCDLVPVWFGQRRISPTFRNGTRFDHGPSGVIRVFTDHRSPDVYIAESNRTLASYAHTGAVTAPACRLQSVPSQALIRLEETPISPQTGLPSPVVRVTASQDDFTPVAPGQVRSNVRVPRDLPPC